MTKAAAILACFLAMGCVTTTQFDIPHQETITLPTGDTLYSVSEDAKDPTGLVTRSVKLFYKDPKTGQLSLVRGDWAAIPGWGEAFVQGGLAGLFQAGGMVGAAALWPASVTNVNQGTNGSPVLQQAQGQQEKQQQGQGLIIIHK